MEKYKSPSYKRAELLMLEERSDDFLFASIHVGQPQGGFEHEYMSIEITDESSGRRILDMKISHKDLMKAITSHEATGIMKLYKEGIELAGKEKQIKYEMVEVEGFSSVCSGDSFIEALEDACKQYEIDGWKASISGWKATKKTNQYTEDSMKTKVNFVRYI